MSGEETPADQQQQTEQTAPPGGVPGPPDVAEPETRPAGEEEEEAPAAPEEEAFIYRALVLTAHGGYDRIKLQEKRGRPALRPGELLVRVRAAGLNFADLLGRQGLYELLPNPPVTPGMEAAGEVEQVGEEVEGRAVGDRVIVLSPSGLWQEVVAVPADHTFLMPTAMTFQEGAAFAVNYVTAHMMLFQMANVRPGKAVLVHMAAGGVGIAATQLCQTVGGVTVFGTASASKHDTIVQGGVTHAIDYRTKDYVEEIRKISPKGLDIVLDPLGGADTQKGFSLLKPMGTLVAFGAANCVTGQKKNLLALAKTWYNQFSVTALRLMQANKAICGFHLGYINDPQLVLQTMSALLELYDQGKIKPRIDSTYHFEEVTDAMRRMQERHNIGKIILLPEAKVEVKPEPGPEPEGQEVSAEAAVPDEKKEEEPRAEEEAVVRV